MLISNLESVFPDLIFPDYLMAESGKPKWFHKLEPKPTSKHQNGIIAPVQHIRLFRDFTFSNIKKSKIAEKLDGKLELYVELDL
jgi:hypothetical protein